MVASQLGCFVHVFCLDIVMICCYEFSYIAISGLPAWRPANWDALHVCLFFCLLFSFVNVLLTNCYDLNDINSVLYMICYEFSPIYKYIYIYIYIYIHIYICNVASQ